MSILRMGTRGSPLARAQSGLIARALEAAHPGLTVDTVVIRTTGDQLATGPLPAGKGLFVKEIEEALLGGLVDFGVHSLKDMPIEVPAGLALAAVPKRATPWDVLVSHRATSVAGLPRAARVGTASVRRRSQLLQRRSDLDIVFLRGNVDTRLAKWRTGELDAIVLAAAGLERLGVEEPAARIVSADEMLPAIGQGALALECRADDARTRSQLEPLDHAHTAIAVAAERGFLRAIGGDCNTPLAAHAIVDGGEVSLRAMVCDPNGVRSLEAAGRAPCSDGPALGERLAADLLARGAGTLLGR
jgi:hydroxymethylbilane synthase